MEATLKGAASFQNKTLQSKIDVKKLYSSFSQNSVIGIYHFFPLTPSHFGPAKQVLALATEPRAKWEASIYQ